MAHHCRRAEIEAERELRGGSAENKWKQLECRVTRYNKERGSVLHEKRGAATSEVLGMWGSGASSMDMSNKGSTPSQGRSAAREKGSMQGMQGREPCCKKLQQLLEVEGMRTEEGVEGIEGENKGREESSEVHNATSKSSMDEDRPEESRHP